MGNFERILLTSVAIVGLVGLTCGVSSSASSRGGMATDPSGCPGRRAAGDATGERIEGYRTGERIYLEDGL